MLLRRNRDFARFWTGEAVSAVGTQVTLLALPLLAVEELDAGAGEMARSGSPRRSRSCCSRSPRRRLGRPLRRRPLLIATNTARALLLALIPLLALLGVLEPLAGARHRVRRRRLHGLLRGRLPVLPRDSSSDDLVEAKQPAHGRHLVAEVSGPGLAGSSWARSARGSRSRSTPSRSSSRPRPWRTAQAVARPSPPRSGLRREIAEGC